jgi:MoxR-like ATPase
MSKLNLFKAAIFTPLARGRWGLPLLAWSTPGAAKSDLLREICESFDLPFISLSPGEMGEGAFGVVPVPDKSGVIKYPPPDWTLTVATGGVILIDEISCFVAGTPVDAVIGGEVVRVPIENLKIGDTVVSVDVASGRSRCNMVSNFFTRRANNLVRVELTDGRHLICTSDHRFLTDAGWVSAGNLPAGSRLCEGTHSGAGYVAAGDDRFDSNVSWATVGTVHALTEGAQVFDITVERDHNFLVNGVVAHNCVPPALQPALLGLVLDARIGGTVLHPRVRRIAAANPPEYAANGYDINAAQANRMGHIDWTAPTVQEHTAYMMRGTTGHGGAAERQFSATAEEERVLTAWDGGAWARAVGLETSFLAARSDLKNKCPKASDPAASRAWPSDRSWTMATRALASADVHGLSPADTDEFVGAFIGHETYAEWATYIREADLPNTADLLDGRVDFKHSADRLDRTVAVLNACCALVAPAEAPRRDERATALWGLLSKLFTTPGTSQDLVLDACLALVRAKVAHNATSAKVRAAYQQLGQHPKFIPLMKAAGFS